MSDLERRASALLRIDLDAIVDNWHRLSNRLSPPCQCAAVVKADGYGLGARVVSAALQRAGCRRFFVATLDEAIALAPHIAGAEVYVLNGPYHHSERDFVDARVRPVLNSMDQVARWAALGRTLGIRLPGILHIDTGMSRLGLTAEEARKLAADGETLASIDLVQVMSHLACADQPDHPMNQRQNESFTRIRRLFPAVPAGLAASSGIFLGPPWHHDWVRPGAALWGVNPTPHKPNPMAQVVRLQGRIIQVRDIDAGDTVGYGAAYRAAGPGRMAVVAAGYADGLFRCLEGRGAGMVGEKRVPLVGRVSMDLVVFDVSAVAPDLVHPGEFIDLIDDDLSIDVVGAAAGTTAYEVLTALSRRSLRRYIGGQL